jgi:hypothetical protein
MYEGFAEDIDTKEYLKKLKEIVKPQVTGTPVLPSPDGAETTRSRPSPANPPTKPSSVLAQGKAYKKNIPKKPTKAKPSRKDSRKDSRKQKQPKGKAPAPKPSKKPVPKSKPAPSNQRPRPSQVLAQGAAYKKTIPAPILKVKTAPANSAVGLVSSSIPPICPPPKIKYVKVPNTCPDMSKYIRKDSIPCWSCKLG